MRPLGNYLADDRIQTSKVFTNFNRLLKTFPGGLNKVSGCAANLPNTQRLIQVSVEAMVVHSDVNCGERAKLNREFFFQRIVKTKRKRKSLQHTAQIKCR